MARHLRGPSGALAHPDVARRTPVLTSRSLSEECGGTVVLKAENLQRTGSFKLRDPLTKLVGLRGARGVVAGSAGNHAQSLAYVARASGLRCDLFMPAEASVAKVAAVRGFGGTVHVGGESVDACVALAREHAADTGAVCVHPFRRSGDHRRPGHARARAARRCRRPGHGGRVGGRRGADQRSRRRPEREPAAGPGGRRAGRGLRAVCRVAQARPRGRGAVGGDDRRRHRDQAPRRPDAAARLPPGGRPRRRGRGRHRGGDRAAAQAREARSRGRRRRGRRRAADGRRPARRAGHDPVVLSGGNIDAGLLAAVARRHETAAGRRLRLFTRISDRPGGLAGLLAHVAAAGGNLVTVEHVREAVPLHVRQTGVELLIETRGAEHADAIAAALAAAGYEVERLEGAR